MGMKRIKVFKMNPDGSKGELVRTFPTRAERRALRVRPANQREATLAAWNTAPLTTARRKNTR